LFDLAFRPEAVEALVKDFPNARILTEIVNVTDDQAVSHATQKTVDVLGSVDILICFAGIVHTAAAQDIAPETWRKVLDVNTTGAWLCAQAVGR
jgi:sorbose reductase